MHTRPETVKKILRNLQNSEVRAKIYNNLALVTNIMEEAELQTLVNDLLPYQDVPVTLREEWKNILSVNKHSWRLIRLLGQDPIVRKEMLENIPWLINYMDCEDTGKIAYQLSNFEGANEAILQNFEALYSSCSSHYDAVLIPALHTPAYRPQVMKALRSARNYYTKEFLNIVRAMKDNPEYADVYEEFGYWEELYHKLPDAEMEQIATSSTLNPQRCKWKKDDIFHGIICGPKVDRADLEIILKSQEETPYTLAGMGTTSIVLRTGDTIVKLGKDKYASPMKYHPRFMMPKFRQEYVTGLCIEIFDYAEKAEVSSEVVLQLYREMEKDGVIWTDAKADNIVILKKDNVLPDWNCGPDFNLYGFSEEDDFAHKKHKVYKKGDYAICDLDLSFGEKNALKSYGPMDELVIQYREEQKKRAKQVAEAKLAKKKKQASKKSEGDIEK